MVALDNLCKDEHAVALHGAWPVDSKRPGPAIVVRKDEDFLPATLAELAGANPAAVVTAHRPEAVDNTLTLYQPVHRVFNLTLVEAHCESFMLPRLDPRKIESAGLVVRRLRRSEDGSQRSEDRGQKAEIRPPTSDLRSPTYDGWCSANGQLIGWVSLGDRSNPLHDRDPDPARRTNSRLTGDPGFDAKFRGPTDAMAEISTSLFTAPPDTAKATTRTLLYGVIPVTSAGRVDLPPKGDEPSRAVWEKHLSLLLRASASPRDLWASAGSQETLARKDLTDFPIRKDPEDQTAEERKADPAPIQPGPTRFVLLVRQLAQEFSLLRPLNSSTRDKLIAELNRLQLPLVNGDKKPAGDYLLAAARFYFETNDDVSNLPRPKSWPALPANPNANNLYNLLRQMSGEVTASFGSSLTRPGRFDDPDDRYVVRAFIRVKCPKGCPPRLVWSEYSEEFRIAPWFEPGPISPAPIQLPDPFDPNFRKSAKPGVTFAVPQSLAKFLNQDPKNILAGKPGPGTELGLSWICGFSIPFITICAFIVLNIILNLLNIVFHWLPFVKICIPFPTKVKK